MDNQYLYSNTEENEEKIVSETITTEVKISKLEISNTLTLEGRDNSNSELKKLDSQYNRNSSVKPGKKGRVSLADLKEKAKRMDVDINKVANLGDKNSNSVGKDSSQDVNYFKENNSKSNNDNNTNKYQNSKEIEYHYQKVLSPGLNPSDKADHEEHNIGSDLEIITNDGRSEDRNKVVHHSKLYLTY
jgi:hypothetical protein